MTGPKAAPGAAIREAGPSFCACDAMPNRTLALMRRANDDRGFDVHYFGDDHASVGAVLFHEYTDAQAAAEYSGLVHGVSQYVPGQFYRRELPCTLKLLERIDEALDEMVIDGYVALGDSPGLGQYLFEYFSGRIPVVGVAKSRYRNSSGIEVLRGRSKRPLYVTSAGIDPHLASERIKAMHGADRVPTLLRRVDLLARQGVR
jgi:deoxyribonuclease V